MFDRLAADDARALRPYVCGLGAPFDVHHAPGDRRCDRTSDRTRRLPPGPVAGAVGLGGASVGGAGPVMYPSSMPGTGVEDAGCS